MCCRVFFTDDVQYMCPKRLGNTIVQNGEMICIVDVLFTVFDRVCFFFFSLNRIIQKGALMKKTVLHRTKSKLFSKETSPSTITVTSTDSC